MEKPGLRDIEILTHCDIRRISRAYLMAKTTPKEVTITLIIGYKDPKDKEHIFEGKPDNLQVFFEYYNPDDIYPTNRFRNIAYERSTRDYVMYLDIDFIFQHDFWEIFENKYMHLLSKEVVMCPLPLFDEFKPAYLDAYEPDKVCSEETEDTHGPILQANFTDSANLFKFHDFWATFPIKEALEDMTPIMRKLRNGTILPEPWGILHRDSYLFADEDFLGRVKDKQQFVCRLLDSGLKFYTMGECVMYHLWHPDSRYDINREKENCTNTLLFYNRYLHKYQNAYFMIAPGTEMSGMRQLLDGFDQPAGQTVLSEEMGSDQIIPELKKRSTIISHAPFKPEYSVYGYKLILVYDSSSLEMEGLLKQLGDNGDPLTAIYNYGYFSLDIDLGDALSVNRKKIQNTMGWRLADSGKKRVSDGAYDYQDRKILSLMKEFLSPKSLI